MDIAGFPNHNALQICGGVRSAGIENTPLYPLWILLNSITVINSLHITQAKMQI